MQDSEALGVTVHGGIGAAGGVQVLTQHPCHHRDDLLRIDLGVCCLAQIVQKSKARFALAEDNFGQLAALLQRRYLAPFVIWWPSLVLLGIG